MDKTVVLSNVKLLIGIQDTDTSKDTLINLLIDKAVKNIKLICNNDFIDDLGNDIFPDTLEDVVEDITVLFYRNRGSEGLNSENVGGISKSFSGDIPVTIKRRLYKYREIVIH